MIAEEFEWTPSGRKLLHDILSIIDHYGGIEEYYKLIKQEIEPEAFKSDNAKMHAVFKNMAKYKISKADSCEMLNMTLSEFNRKLAIYRNKVGIV